tara:strand:- start:14515 stop:15783 length:1269 start_codon:yes stop_codon:yes gene_type:complete
MAIPKLNPASTSNANILPATGSTVNVAATLPFGVYAGTPSFLSGAADQVAFTYKKLGGDVLDIELAEGNVYAAYEEAVLEYSYLINLHQTKNSLSSLLGAATGSFDQNGQLVSGSALSGSNIALRYPRFDYGYVRRITEGLATEAGIGGLTPIYSASLNMTSSKQDYDLQSIISSSAANDSSVAYYGKVKDKRLIIRKVFFKTPRAMWRFYGYYGGFSVVGNMRTYGQYADDSTFEIVPTWQNKLQAMAYEDALFTRISHYSYEIKDNMLRLFPSPDSTSPKKFWVQFSIQREYEPWEETGRGNEGTEGINNINTLPFENLPYQNINSIGKQWIRRFALALTKEILGQVRGKFATVPIPGESVTLNAAELLGQARTEQDQLREELKTLLNEITYDKLAITDSSMQDATKKVVENVPVGIFVG